VSGRQGKSIAIVREERMTPDPQCRPESGKVKKAGEKRPTESSGKKRSFEKDRNGIRRRYSGGIDARAKLERLLLFLMAQGAETNTKPSALRRRKGRGGMEETAVTKGLNRSKSKKVKLRYSKKKCGCTRHWHERGGWADGKCKGSQ